MRFPEVLRLTEEVLAAALGDKRLSFEDDQVAAASQLQDIDAILTNDRDSIRGHDWACSPRDLVPLPEAHTGERTACRAVRVTPEGAFRVEIAKPRGGWRQTLRLSGFPTEE